MHERTDERSGYANGYAVRFRKTWLGKLALRFPQVPYSDEPFLPETLRALMLSEFALSIARAEIYVHGVATRMVKGVL